MGKPQSNKTTHLIKLLTVPCSGANQKIDLIPLVFSLYLVTHRGVHSQSGEESMVPGTQLEAVLFAHAAHVKQHDASAPTVAAFSLIPSPAPHIQNKTQY